MIVNSEDNSFMKKNNIYLSALLMTKILLVVAFAQSTFEGVAYGKSDQVYGMGARETTPEESAKMEQRHVVGVRANQLALSRKIAELKSNGQPVPRVLKNSKVTQSPIEEVQVEIIPPASGR